MEPSVSDAGAAVKWEKIGDCHQEVVRLLASRGDRASGSGRRAEVIATGYGNHIHDDLDGGKPSYLA